MAISISIEVSRNFDVSADLDKVFALLSDVPASASFFPKVQQLTDLGDNSYRWEMEKVGLDKHALQTVYASRYHADKEKRLITWEPVKGVGNGEVSGFWKLLPGDGKTSLQFSTKATLELPLPGLLKLAISPVVKHEFSSLLDTYIANLQRHFAAA